LQCVLLRGDNQRVDCTVAGWDGGVAVAA